jgi:hypothetical protein
MDPGVGRIDPLYRNFFYPVSAFACYKEYLHIKTESPNGLFFKQDHLFLEEFEATLGIPDPGNG